VSQCLHVLVRAEGEQLELYPNRGHVSHLYTGAGTSGSDDSGYPVRYYGSISFLH